MDFFFIPINGLPEYRFRIHFQVVTVVGISEVEVRGLKP